MKITNVPLKTKCKLIIKLIYSITLLLFTKDKQTKINLKKEIRDYIHMLIGIY